MNATYLLIRCEQGLEKTVIDRLQRTKGISECRETVGTFDIIAKLEFAGESVIPGILKMPEVRRVSQLPCRDGGPEILVSIA